MRRDTEKENPDPRHLHEVCKGVRTQKGGKTGIQSRKVSIYKNDPAISNPILGREVGGFGKK